MEKLVPGYDQVAINDKVGLTFAVALRNILRHDPDAIMVGEIRDEETASIAVRAAQTGHVVLSTLHTNTALGAVTRLIDMGLAPYLLAETLLCVVAQRLIPRLCETCKVDAPASGRLLDIPSVND